MKGRDVSSPRIGLLIGVGKVAGRCVQGRLGGMLSGAQQQRPLRELVQMARQIVSNGHRPAFQPTFFPRSTVSSTIMTWTLPVKRVGFEKEGS